MDICNCIGKLFGKVGVCNGFNGNFLLSVLCTCLGQFAKYHIRIVYKVLVDCVTAFGLAEMNPIRFNFDRSVTLLQKQNIRNNARAGIGKKGVIG